ncbi:MAG: hypothetical protein E6971_14735 [Clostridium perfringens]|nr:hypothetical protein [Clostridium perfringens]
MNKEVKRIYRSKKVKSYFYGDTLELTTATGHKGRKYYKLSDTEYIDINGELKQFKKSTRKSDNLDSVKKTMRRLRRLIANNFNGSRNELWITLTYKENMRDQKRLSSDMRQFMKKLRRKYGSLEYIAVLEPQKRGAWHYHILLKRNDLESLYIANKDIAKFWGHGFTKTTALTESDNVSAYLMAYLTDLDLNEDVKTDKKKIVKGLRLEMYPPNMQIYRCSNGIVKPIEDNGTQEQMVNKYLNEYYGNKKHNKALHNRDNMNVTPDFYGEKKIKSAYSDGRDMVVETEFYNFKQYSKGGESYDD